MEFSIGKKMVMQDGVRFEITAIQGQEVTIKQIGNARIRFISMKSRLVELINLNLILMA